MKKTILVLAIAVFLVAACSQQKPEDLVGQGSPVGEQMPAGSANTGEKVVSADNVKEFKMTAKQFEFSPSTIEVNKGDKVRLIVTSVDVPHGIAIKEYNINERLDVGKPKIIEFTADKEGTFTAFCSVVCGAGHSNMKGQLIVK